MIDQINLFLFYKIIRSIIHYEYFHKNTVMQIQAVKLPFYFGANR